MTWGCCFKCCHRHSHVQWLQLERSVHSREWPDTWAPGSSALFCCPLIWLPSDGPRGLFQLLASCPCSQLAGKKSRDCRSYLFPNVGPESAQISLGGGGFPMASGSSQARDQTHAIAVTMAWATAVTMLDCHCTTRELQIPLLMTPHGT